MTGSGSKPGSMLNTPHVILETEATCPGHTGDLTKTWAVLMDLKQECCPTTLSHPLQYIPVFAAGKLDGSEPCSLLQGWPATVLLLPPGVETLMSGIIGLCWVLCLLLNHVWLGAFHCLLQNNSTELKHGKALQQSRVNHNQQSDQLELTNHHN